VRFVQTWDTLGMRATQSNDLRLDGLFVPDRDLVHSLPVDHYDARILKTVFAWAMPTFGAVYLGIAAGAVEWARQSLIGRGRQHDPLVRQVFGEIEILIETARAVLWRHAQDVISGALFEQVPVQEGLARCALAKSVPANNSVEVMQRLVDVVGGAAYTRKLPLERMWRDVQGGPIMPYNNLATKQLLGAASLGLELHPTIPPEESGHQSRPQPWPPVGTGEPRH
jgi:alkylation response protein AidB-like acyl-CoA dehydrogenase